MSKQITHREYCEEVDAIARGLWAESIEWETSKDDDPETRIEAAREFVTDSYLHENIDGHQWIIYPAYNMSVLDNSDNRDYFSDYVGGADDVLREGTLGDLLTIMAFWALYADVLEAFNDMERDYHLELRNARLSEAKDDE